MALLEPGLLLADEGLLRTLGIVGRALRDPAALRRVTVVTDRATELPLTHPGRHPQPRPVPR
ncbi:hypothetical protein [Streptomyces sporangiiformans]|uniref:hypothetical protein n=1 Tax=Streptomyces sporangiiformans TaxID=2315329 RepID=UPI0019691547|nr:hypothetical protein [Streptomyces sporangiiformans]